MVLTPLIAQLTLLGETDSRGSTPPLYSQVCIVNGQIPKTIGLYDVRTAGQRPSAFGVFHTARGYYGIVELMNPL